MFAQVIATATDQYPRHSEGDVAVLPDGRLLLAYTRFEGSDEDDAPATIVGLHSSDRGRSWSKPVVLQPNEFGRNCMSASLVQLPEGDLLLFFLRKNANTDCQVVVRRSSDAGRTWGEALTVTDGAGYYVMNNARVVRLSTGRLVAPVARADDAGGPVDGSGHFRSTCYLSDDGGVTWRQSQTWLDLGKRGAMEPGVAEVRDGSLYMVIRTQLGRLFQATSKDGGETWEGPTMTMLTSPEAPASVARVPGQPEMVIVWNDNHDRGRDHGGVRSPLRAAVSYDGGYHWYRYHTLEGDTRAQFAYTSITFVEDEVLLTYYEQRQPGRVSLKLQAVPAAALHEIDDWRLRADVEGQSAQVYRVTMEPMVEDAGAA